MIFGRNGSGIKKAAGIVQFDPPRLVGFRCRPHGGEDTVHLCGNEPTAHGIQSGITPKIAHEASPWAFAIGEKHGQDFRPSPLAVRFVFDQPLHRWIECQTTSSGIQIRSLRQNPSSAPRRVVGEWGVHPV